jgi:hypothetical protein
MPGAPNRPPEIEAAPTAPLPADQTSRRLIRRLGPARVALHLDLWKGAPSTELVLPLQHAETNFASGDLVTASGNMDQLAVRFAEPRWPLLPAPFKELRQKIPAPQPPQWNPDFKLTPEEREQLNLRRDAELQRDLAKASIEWGASHQVDLSDLLPHLERATLALGTAVDEAFWTEIDRIWIVVRERVPMPTAGGRKPAPAEAVEPA